MSPSHELLNHCEPLTQAASLGWRELVMYRDLSMKETRMALASPGQLTSHSCMSSDASGSSIKLAKTDASVDGIMSELEIQA